MQALCWRLESFFAHQTYLRVAFNGLPILWRQFSLILAIRKKRFVYDIFFKIILELSQLIVYYFCVLAMKVA